MSQGERARRVVETAVGTRTYSRDARRIVPSNGRLLWLRWRARGKSRASECAEYKKHTVITEA